MTGQELITKLRDSGFSLFLSGDGVGYRFTGVGEPDKNQVVPILEELRLRRSEVKRLLITQEPENKDLKQYEEVFSLALAEIAPLDPQGIALRKIQKIPEIWGPIQEAENEVNRLWQIAQRGQMVWRKYCLAVEKWRNLFAQALEKSLLDSEPKGITNCEKGYDVTEWSIL
jgi:hypothetical protein